MCASITHNIHRFAAEDFRFQVDDDAVFLIRLRIANFSHCYSTKRGIALVDILIFVKLNTHVKIDTRLRNSLRKCRESSLSVSGGVANDNDMTSAPQEFVRT